jgi:hypothetical protein
LVVSCRPTLLPWEAEMDVIFLFVLFLQQWLEFAPKPPASLQQETIDVWIECYQIGDNMYSCDGGHS